MRDLIQQANDATYEAWCAHDPDAVAAVFAEDAVAYDVGNPEPLRGRQAIRERSAEVMAAFPDFRLERLVLLIDGDMNADRWRAMGTHRGAAFMGIEPGGRSFDVEGASFSWFGGDGLVVKDVHHWDVPSLLTQLGVFEG
jgi:predicted ester cyclase